MEVSNIFKKSLCSQDRIGKLCVHYLYHAPETHKAVRDVITDHLYAWTGNRHLDVKAPSSTIIMSPLSLSPMKKYRWPLSSLTFPPPLPLLKVRQQAVLILLSLDVVSLLETSLRPITNKFCL